MMPVSLNFNQTVEVTATVLLALALAHTFLAKKLNQFARRFQEGSVLENLFHLLGEIEVVFGFWAAIFVAAIAIQLSGQHAIQYLESRVYTEPLFVFVIMAMCATQPLLELAKKGLSALEAIVPMPKSLRAYFVLFGLGPLIGSLITEPAAMTLIAMLALSRFFARTENLKFKYATLGLLFVNVSIGGTLTHFAAPPVLMVASAWNWDSLFMLTHFGWKAVSACLISTLIFALYFRTELKAVEAKAESDKKSLEKKSTSAAVPIWVSALHAIFVAGVIVFAHHPVLFMGLFLFFLGLVTVTREYQTELKLKESLLVGFFLAGLVVLGGPQGWWLTPILGQLGDLQLFLGATGLTAITDNAALTYLGTLVPTLSDSARLALVGGAVTGGGLTVIANAPNPAGYGILNSSFGPDGIGAGGLFLGAMIPTLIATVFFGFL